MLLCLFVSCLFSLAFACDVKWVQGSFSDITNIPVDAVGLNGCNYYGTINTNYVVRLRLNQNFLTAGKLLVYFKALVLPGYGWLDQNSNTLRDYKASNVLFFDFLTNPNKCLLSWIPAANGNAPPNALLLSKGFPYPGFTYAISIITSPYPNCNEVGTIFIPNYGNEPPATEVNAYGTGIIRPQSYSVLSLLEPTIVINNINYQNNYQSILDKQSQVTSFGVQTITNPTGAEMKRTITISSERKVNFQYSFSISRKVSVSISLTFNFPFDLGNINAAFGYEVNTDSSQTYSTELTKSYSITDELTVPKGVSVKVTGCMDWVENVAIPFTATARVSAPGLTGQQVNTQYVATDSSLKVVSVNSNDVTVQIAGTMRGAYGYNIDTSLQCVDANTKAVIRCPTMK